MSVIVTRFGRCQKDEGIGIPDSVKYLGIDIKNHTKLLGKKKQTRAQRIGIIKKTKEFRKGTWAQAFGKCCEFVRCNEEFRDLKPYASFLGPPLPSELLLGAMQQDLSDNPHQRRMRRRVVCSKGGVGPRGFRRHSRFSSRQEVV